MTTALWHPPPGPTRPHPMYTASYKVLRLRAHTLAITDLQVEACQTMRELQALAHTHYRRLAQRYHPDSQAGRPPGGPPLNGHMFRRVEKAYRWLMAQPAGGLVPWSGRPPPPVEVLEHEYPDLGFGFHLEYH